MEHLDCPECGSENTQNLAHYVQMSTVASHGYILGALSKSPTSSSLLAASTHSQSVNAVARANRTPQNPKPVGFLILGLFSGILALSASPLLSIALVTAGVFGMIKAEKYKADIYPGKLAAYQRKWLCQRCGGIFIIAPAASDPEKLSHFLTD